MTLPRITIAALEALEARALEDVEAAHEAACFLDCAFWESGDPETLYHGDPREAVEAVLDHMHPGPIPVELEVTGYKRQVLGPNDPDPDMILEYVLESLDNDGEFNSGDEPTEITEPMRAAAVEFCRAIRAEYKPWNCEEACVVVYDAETLKGIVAELWPDSARLAAQEKATAAREGAR